MLTDGNSNSGQSHALIFNNQQFDTDLQGFLKHRLSWTADLGAHMASLDGIQLTDEHWEIIHYFREYYEDYNIPPPMRMVIRVFRKAFGEDNANSRYLMSLFPETVTKSASKYAGLPKPKNCK